MNGGFVRFRGALMMKKASAGYDLTNFVFLCIFRRWHGVCLNARKNKI